MFLLPTFALYGFKRFLCILLEQWNYVMISI